MTNPDRPLLPAVQAPADPGLVAAVRLPADRHPAAVYLARLAPGSRRAMRGALDLVARELTGGRADAASLAWPALRYQHVAAVRARLAERLAPPTVNKTLAAVRGVVREAWRLGLVAAEVHQSIADIQGVRGERLAPGRALTVRERQKLYEAAPDGPSGARDAALLAVLDGCGLRRAEAAACDLGDADPAAESLAVRRGKGGKGRIVPLTNGARDAVRDWLAVRGAAPGPLLCAVAKGGRVKTGARLTTQAVYNRVRWLADRAKVARFSPHDFRRTLIGDLLDAGADLATVSAMVGHASVQTTARYDRRGEAAKRRAAALRAVPYRSRKSS